MERYLQLTITFPNGGSLKRDGAESVFDPRIPIVPRCFEILMRNIQRNHLKGYDGDSRSIWCDK